MRWKSAICIAALALSACGKDNNENNGSDLGQTTPDTGTNGGVDMGPPGDDMSEPDMGPMAILGSRIPVPEQDGVQPDGAFSDAPPAGEARAGRITGTETGFHGLWSHCKVGDFRLINDHVDACISNEISSRYETFAGGGLLDVRPRGSELADIFDLYIGKIGYNTIYAETVEVVRDGTDGGAAVIRVTGSDMPASYFVGVAGDNLFSQMNLTTVTEYRLGPDSDAIEILTFVSNQNDTPAMVQKGDLIAWGDRTDIFRQRTGFETNNSAFGWMAASGAGQAFAWVLPDEDLRSLSSSFGDAPWEITIADAFVLQPQEAYSHFGYFVVSDQLDTAVKRAVELGGGDAPAPRMLTVTDASGAPVVGRRVQASTADEHVTGGITDANGQVQLSLSDGTVTLVVSELAAGGGGFTGEIPVSADMTAEVAQPGIVSFDVTSGGNEIPASIVLRQGEMALEGAVWSGAGRTQVQVMPGDWDVVVSHGTEFDAFQGTVSVTAGETTVVTAELARLLDTADWLAADFHQHMEPSSDSRVWLEDRVMNNAGHGIEVVVPTDHDVVTDLIPVIEAASLSGVMSTFPGAELSPALAHTNVYPLPWVAEKPGRGAITLAVLDDDGPRRRTVPELIAEARALPTDPVVQINHPRDSSGLFDYVDFDPELGPEAVDSRWFTTDFDAMELSNGDDCMQFKDLSGLWNAGVEPTPIGSSDSHGLWNQVGTQKTYLHAPGVAPGEITAEQLRDIVKAGQVSVATSVFVDFTDGTIPGDTLDGSSGSVELAVRVQSAHWVGATELHVVVNGVRTQVIDITPIDATLDYAGTVTVPVSSDSWVAVMAVGAATGQFRPTGTLPWGVTSPVRIDADGNGYTAPGVGPLDLDDVPVCR